MDTPVAKMPAHEQVYQRLREMILYGELAPGQAVTIQGLESLLGFSMTPVREAIRRLTAEGALVAQGNRRVCVPELSPSQLEQIDFARSAIEPHLAAAATNRITTGGLAALRAADDALNAAIARGDVKAYLQQNYRFHMLLYEASGDEILTAMARMLWLRVGPSLRVVCGRLGTQNLPDMHEEALAALGAADAEAVASAISEDIRQGMDQVRASMAS